MAKTEVNYSILMSVDDGQFLAASNKGTGRRIARLFMLLGQLIKTRLKAGWSDKNITLCF